MTVDLAVLRALRAKMTPGKWYADEGAIYAADESHPSYDMRVALTGAAAKMTAAINRGEALPNAAGIVATHEAADTLIEVAEAALTLRDQERTAARARFECDRRGGRDIPDAMIIDLANAEARLTVCQNAYDAALAKVSKGESCTSVARRLADGHEICRGCDSEIDPETCQCGEAIDSHGYHSGHSAVPMGCRCHSQRTTGGSP